MELVLDIAGGKSFQSTSFLIPLNLHTTRSSTESDICDIYHRSY